MSMSNIFQQLHGILDPSTLIPMSKKPDVVKPEKLKEICDYLEVDQSNVYFDPNNLINWCIYYDGLLYMPLHAMIMEVLKSFHAKEALHHQLERIQKCVNDKNYELLFHIIDKKILIPAFIKYYKEIPVVQIYDVFIDLYQRTEYGFDKIPKKVVKFALEHRNLSKEWKERMEALLKKTKKKEFVKIYRGETEKSTPNNMSWTLKKSVAEFFANRFNSQGKVITKTVKVSELLDYLTSRSEEEVFYLTNPL